MVDPDDPFAFSPASKPAFLDPERAAAAAMPAPAPPQVLEDKAHDASHSIPTYDHELESALGEEPEPPGIGIRVRHQMVARFAALGMTPTQIARRCNYTMCGVSIILRTPWVQWEISRYRRVAEEDAMQIMRDTAPEAARRIREFIVDPGTKPQLALDAAKFTIERIHGKARQELNVESNTLGDFMRLLAERRSRVTPTDVTPLLDVTPALAATPAADHSAVNPWDKWVSENTGTKAKETLKSS